MLILKKIKMSRTERLNFLKYGLKLFLFGHLPMRTRVRLSLSCFDAFIKGFKWKVIDKESAPDFSS